MIYAIIILAILQCAACAGCVYFKMAYLTEYGRKWDLVSENLTLEKEIENWKEVRDVYVNTLGRVAGERDALQEKYSAVMCPTNNHIWHDGRCKKCGAWRENVGIIGESFIKAGPKGQQHRAERADPDAQMDRRRREQPQGDGDLRGERVFRRAEEEGRRRDVGDAVPYSRDGGAARSVRAGESVSKRDGGGR